MAKILILFLLYLCCSSHFQPLLLCSYSTQKRMERAANTLSRGLCQLYFTYFSLKCKYLQPAMFKWKEPRNGIVPGHDVFTAYHSIYMTARSNAINMLECQTMLRIYTNQIYKYISYIVQAWKNIFTRNVLHIFAYKNELKKQALLSDYQAKKKKKQSTFCISFHLHFAYLYVFSYECHAINTVCSCKSCSL